jgi:hypothetical protein
VTTATRTFAFGKLGETVVVHGYIRSRHVDLKSLTRATALGKGCHGGVSSRSIPVRWHSILVVPESECPHPRRTDGRRIGLIDATDNLAVAEHVKPRAGRPTECRPL